MQEFTQEQITKVHQYTIEDTYSRKNIYSEVANDIMTGINADLKNYYDESIMAITLWISDSSAYDSKHCRKNVLRTQNVANIVTELFIILGMQKTDTPIQNISDQLSRHLGFNEEQVFEAITAAAEILGICVDIGIYDIVMSQGESMHVRSYVTLETKTEDFINKTMYLNPMICRPEDWERNVGGGYLSTCDSVLLGKHNNHKEDQALDALNILQSIEFELDEEMLEYMEMPKKTLETNEAAEEFTSMVTMSERVYRDLYDQGNTFHFVWKFDFRGRAYSQGYYVNLQASSYKKSLLNFKYKRLIK